MAVRNNKLILVSDKAGFSLGQKGGEEFHWLFLGRDYETLSNLKRSAPAKFHYVDISQLLNANAYEQRRPFLDYIGSLSRRFASLAWWTSRVAERNVMVSPVFLYFCYLKIVDQLLSGELNAKNIYILSESPALLRTISRLPQVKHFALTSHSDYVWNLLIGLLKAVYRSARFIIRSFLLKLTALALLKRTAEVNSPVTLVRTWVGEKNLGADSVFRDSYFPGLEQYLGQKKINVAILPILFGIKRSYREVLRWFNSSSTRFIVPEKYYRLSDYLRTIIISLRSLLIFRRSFKFANMELTWLFREESVRTFRLGGCASVTMHYFLIKRLCQSDIEIERCIYTFENMFPEKPLLLGLARFSPRTRSIGFQHASLFPLLLSSYTSDLEAEVLPLPDKIVCSGSFFAEVLAREGFPRDRLMIGPALRFAYLLQANGSDIMARPKNIALITLPLARSNALELLIKSLIAMGHKREIELWIKPHPMMSQAELEQIISGSGLDKRPHKIVSGSMAMVLPKVSLLIATASATIFDAVAFGVPVIRVRSDLDLNLDPMDWFPTNELCFVGLSPQDISEQVDRIVGLDDHSIEQLKINGQRLISQCFSPVTEDNLAVFSD
ncbi:hypothetical protein ACFL4J_01345 [Candidatus Margulisiibacteriota bacterium]